MDRIDRLTEHAAQVLRLAKEEAERDGGGYFGTEHLLLGLLRAPCLASRTLAALGVTEAAVRAELAGVERPSPLAGTAGIESTKRVQHVFELGSATARELGHPAVGSGHLLLALYAEGDSVAVHVLRALGAGEARVPDQVRRQLAEGGDAPATRRPSRPVVDPALLDDARDLAAHEGAPAVTADHVRMAMDPDRPLRTLARSLRDVSARVQNAIDGGDAETAVRLRAEERSLTERLDAAIAAWRAGEK